MNKINCPKCGKFAYKAKIMQYNWRAKGYDISKGYITIENARIVRCGICGEFPVDEEEKRRWEKLAWQEEMKEVGDAAMQCSVCGIPARKTGSMYSIGYYPDQVHFCQNCYDEKTETN